MEPWTLAHRAGKQDMAIIKRYIHPQTATIMAAMDRARASQAVPVAPQPASASLPS
jgi:hypothetical protein